MKISLQFGTMQMVLFLPIGSWSEKSLWYKTFALGLIQNFLEEFCYWLKFCVPVYLRWFRPFKTLLPLASVIPVFPLSEFAFRLKKIFSFRAGYFYYTLLSGGEKQVSYFSCENFFVRSIAFSVCVFRFDFATSVSGLLIPVQNDHLNFQIGFCLFCFFRIHPFRPWMRRLTSGADSLLFL